MDDSSKGSHGHAYARVRGFEAPSFLMRPSKMFLRLRTYAQSLCRGGESTCTESGRPPTID